MTKLKDRRKQLQLPISQIEKLENEAAKIQNYLDPEGKSTDEIRNEVIQWLDEKHSGLIQ